MDGGALQGLLNEATRRYAVPGAQLGLLRGGERLVVCSGVLGTDDPAPVVPSTSFHAASLGKSLTGLVVGEAARRGELDLGRPCSEQGEGQWPETPEAILAQTTGRPNVLPAAEETVETFVARTAELPRVHEPGRFSYCNTGWAALDLLLRQRCNRSMEQSALDLVGGHLTFGVPPGASLGHLALPGRPPVPVALDAWPAVAAAGSRWWATADVLLDYARLHLRDGDGRVDPEVVRSVRSPHARLPGATVFDSWGAGWAVWDRGAHQAFGWAGYTSGHRAFLRCFPDADAALVLLANSAGSLFGPPGGSALFDALLPEVLSDLGVPALTGPAYDEPESPVAALTGHYGPVVLEADGDALRVQAAAFGLPGPVRCVRLGGNTFNVDGSPPGSTPLAVDGELLYLGPFAFPRG